LQRWAVFLLFFLVFFIFSGRTAFAVPDPFYIKSTEPAPVVLETALIPLLYANAKTVSLFLQDKTSALLSLQGSVLADERTNRLWVQETPEQLIKIKRLVTQLDIPVRQVLITAKIVNLDKLHEKEFGVRFGLGRSQPLTGAAQEGTVSQGLNVDLPAELLFTNSARLGLSVAKVGGGILLDMELSAMQRENLLEVVASPRLIASHERSALIESGTEIPYQAETQGGGTTATFKKAVMSLEVTPHMMQNHQVLLSLDIRQDKPGVAMNGAQTIDTQHMQTQVIVQNGETVVVGGIQEKQTQTIIERVPILSDLPLIGKLFMRKALREDNKELLIFITPTILEAPV
jgi:type IV pilus assembly protein PilQ